MNTEKTDIYQRVTDQIVSAIEEGAESYRMPWNSSGEFIYSPINAASRKPYRGINIAILWASAQARGFKSGTWATYKQWLEAGAQVRKGEKSTHVVFWKFFDVQSNDEEKNEKRIPMVRDYFVFNADQVDGYTEPAKLKLSHSERITQAEEFFRSLEVEIRPGGNRAFYNIDADVVHMPAFESFKEALFYYSVLSHETTHWTGAAKRLNRNLSSRFGTDAYAMEELVAELGAAFLCSELSIPTDPRRDHAPYIASWVSALRRDKRAIFTAAAKAQEALDWMLRRSAPEESEEAA